MKKLVLDFFNQGLVVTGSSADLASYFDIKDVSTFLIKSADGFAIPDVISQIKDGKLRALAVTSLARSPLLPGVATLDEQGIKGYEVNTWFGFVAPAGTPDAVIDKLNQALNRVLASAEAKDKLAPMGFGLAPPNAPAAFAKLIADDLAHWVPIVKASGAKAD